MKFEIEFSAPVCCEDCRFRKQYTSFDREVNCCLLYDKYADREVNCCLLYDKYADREVNCCLLYDKYADRSEYNTENNRKIADDCITYEELLLLEEIIGYIPSDKKIFKCSKNGIKKDIYNSDYRHLYEQDIVRIKEQGRSNELPAVITYYATEKGFKIMERILKIKIKNEC